MAKIGQLFVIEKRRECIQEYIHVRLDRLVRLDRQVWRVQPDQRLPGPPRHSWQMNPSCSWSAGYSGGNRAPERNPHSAGRNCRPVSLSCRADRQTRDDRKESDRASTPWQAVCQTFDQFQQAFFCARQPDPRSGENKGPVRCFQLVDQIATECRQIRFGLRARPAPHQECSIARSTTGYPGAHPAIPDPAGRRRPQKNASGSARTRSAGSRMILAYLHTGAAMAMVGPS